jgi:hypothetical protein
MRGAIIFGYLDSRTKARCDCVSFLIQLAFLSGGRLKRKPAPVLTRINVSGSGIRPTLGRFVFPSNDTSLSVPRLSPLRVLLPGI